MFSRVRGPTAAGVTLGVLQAQPSSIFRSASVSLVGVDSRQPYRLRLVRAVGAPWWADDHPGQASAAGAPGPRQPHLYLALGSLHPARRPFPKPHQLLPLKGCSRPRAGSPPHSRLWPAPTDPTSWWRPARIPGTGFGVGSVRWPVSSTVGVRSAPSGHRTDPAHRCRWAPSCHDLPPVSRQPPQAGRRHTGRRRGCGTTAA